MEEMKIWHNASCSKSREVMNLLSNTTEQISVFEYKKEEVTVEMLEDLIQKLQIKPIDLVRKKEIVFQEKFEGRKLTRKQIIQAMVKYPELIERPIVIVGDKAVVARPLENIQKIIPSFKLTVE